MKSIEKLRTAARNMAKGRNLEHHEECNLLLRIADEIEAEIAERYMELPTDADCKPIHIGDGIRISVNKTVAAEFVRCDAVAFEHGDGLAWKLSENVLNVQNLTVEDILRDLVEAVSHEQAGEAYLDLLLADFGDEIRELLGVIE